ncbi:hypothetical protein DMB38_34690 [Streptomyces sp. WAC 06738]|nr:hypothetical protein DMB38_34690 [Streptomyces sp. WAC 06738]
MLAGVAGGYLLGRTRKAKLALTVAALVAGRRLAPQDLLGAGARRIADSPQLAAASGQGTDQMVTAARAALGSLVDRRVASLSDSLRERTDRLGGLREEREARDAGAGRDEDDESRDRRTAASTRRPPARRKTTRTARPTTSGPRQKAAAGAERGSRGTAKSARTTADRPSRRQRP